MLSLLFLAGSDEESAQTLNNNAVHILHLHNNLFQMNCLTELNKSMHHSRIVWCANIVLNGNIKQWHGYPKWLKTLREGAKSVFSFIYCDPSSSSQYSDKKKILFNVKAVSCNGQPTDNVYLISVFQLIVFPDCNFPVLVHSYITHNCCYLPQHWAVWRQTKLASEHSEAFYGLKCKNQLGTGESR